MNILNRSIAALLIAVLTLIGCGGGGGGSSPPATTLSGTAAVGFPIVNGTVNVTCAAGTTISGIANTSATGAWSVNVAGQTLPCAVQVTGGTINGVTNATTYQSIATSIGTVNVTPLTNLVMANLTGTTIPSTWFAGLTPAQLNAITTAQVTTAVTNVQTALGLTALNTINPITLAFNANSGVVMDDILTALRNAMMTANVTYASLLNSAGATAGATITPPAGLSAALAAAYAGTTSGGSGGVPSAPIVNAPVVVGSANINLAWPAVSGATAYNVYRSTAAGVAITPANRVATSYPSIVFSDAGLTAATTYYYKVTATNAAGESVGSVEVSATTNAGAGSNTSAPTGLTATVDSITNTQVNLSWNAVPGATQYIVYRSTTPGMAALLASNAVMMVGTTTANVTGHSAATTYYYAVQTTTPGSVASAEVSVTTPSGVVARSVIVSTIAGTAGLAGIADGTGAAARFDLPDGITSDNAGNLYVTEHNNHTIRKITPAGVVTTLAGKAAGSLGYGYANGMGAAAKFSGPSGITIDSTGNLYVTDTFNHTIRKITPVGMVSTFAGTALMSGAADGIGTAASFSFPTAITSDSADNLYVLDTNNGKIRKITPAGVVTTLVNAASGAAISISNPTGITLDIAGNLYVADGGTIRKITPAGVVTTLIDYASGAAAGFIFVKGMTVGITGSLYVTDALTIREITPAGVVTTLAGNAKVSGSANGSGAAATFGNISGITADSAGNLYVTDSNHTIRKIQ